jgi:hypothetical protein
MMSEMLLRLDPGDLTDLNERGNVGGTSRKEKEERRKALNSERQPPTAS